MSTIYTIPYLTGEARTLAKADALRNHGKVKGMTWAIEVMNDYCRLRVTYSLVTYNSEDLPHYVVRTLFEVL